jgi:O-antigen/teichoic acid export membrane protein
MSSLLAFAWPGWLQGVGMAAYTWIDHVLLAGLRSVEAAGAYGPVATIAPLFGIGLQALGAPLAPRIAERHAAGDLAGVQAAYRSVTRWALLLALPPVAVCVVVPEAVLGCWPNGSAEAVTALRVTALAQLGCTAVGSVNVLLLMAGRPRAALANALPALALNLALSWWLIPRVGVTGAALANAGAMLTANGMALAQVWTALRVHPFDTGAGRVILAGAAGACAALGVRALGLGPLATTATAGLLAGAGVLGAYALLGATDEDRALVRGTWARLRGGAG